MDIQKELWTFTNVQRRMILHDSLATRQAGNISSLQRLSRETVQLSLLNNNTQERLAGPLVDRLGQDLGWNGWEKGEKLLRAMASYPGSGESHNSVLSFVFIISIFQVSSRRMAGSRRMGRRVMTERRRLGMSGSRTKC